MNTLKIMTFILSTFFGLNAFSYVTGEFYLKKILHPWSKDSRYHVVLLEAKLKKKNLKKCIKKTLYEEQSFYQSGSSWALTNFKKISDKYYPTAAEEDDVNNCKVGHVKMPFRTIFDHRISTVSLRVQPKCVVGMQFNNPNDMSSHRGELYIFSRGITIHDWSIEHGDVVFPENFDEFYACAEKSIDSALDRIQVKALFEKF